MTGLSINDTTLKFEANGSATEFSVLGFRRRDANEIKCVSYINTAPKDLNKLEWCWSWDESFGVSVWDESFGMSCG